MGKAINQGNEKEILRLQRELKHWEKSTASSNKFSGCKKKSLQVMRQLMAKLQA